MQQTKIIRQPETNFTKHFILFVESELMRE